MKTFDALGTGQCKAVQILSQSLFPCKIYHPLFTSFTFLKASCYFLFFESFHPFGICCLQSQWSYVTPLMWPLRIFFISWQQLSKKQERWSFVTFRKQFCSFFKIFSSFLSVFQSKCSIRGFEQSRFCSKTLSVFFQEILLRKLCIWKLNTRSCGIKKCLHCPHSMRPLHSCEVFVHQLQ